MRTRRHTHRWLQARSTRQAILVWITVAVASCATPIEDRIADNQPAACAFSAADQDWVDRAISAWRFASTEIAGISHIDEFQAVLFNSSCIAVSDSALLTNAAAIDWQHRPHRGLIELPDGDEMPSAVTSFTSSGENVVYFAMSTPSVWRAGGVTSSHLDLETLMVAVLLHEGSHVAQSSTYGKQIEKLAEEYSLPESFSDDSLQHRFEDEAPFADSIQRETDLFFEAAFATDLETAVEQASEARRLMLARAERWYRGRRAVLAAGGGSLADFRGGGTVDCLRMARERSRRGGIRGGRRQRLCAAQQVVVPE